MFALSSSLRFYLYHLPTDMRKSFCGLGGIVTNELGTDPSDGSVFVFVNKRRDRLKLLHWEPGGFVLYYKRLESGRLELPQIDGKKRQLAWADLTLIIEGINVEKVKRKKRFYSTISGG